MDSVHPKSREAGVFGSPKFSLKDSLIILYVILGFGGICLILLEIVCGQVQCPETSISLPTMGAILLSGLLQFRFLRLWKRHPQVMAVATSIAVMIVVLTIIGVISGLLKGW